METIYSILTIYAVMNLVLLPLTIAALVLMQKKSKFLDKFNQWLDGFLDDKKAEPAPANTNAEEKEKPKELSEEEKNLRDGIAMFTLGIGDTYNCRLNSLSNGKQIYGLRWFSENEFIGTFEKDSSKFTALKEGQVKIFCARKDDDFDSGTIVYEITVKPDTAGWFAEKTSRMVLSRTKKAAVMSHFLERKILSENPQEGIIVYEGVGPEKRLSLQFNKGEELVRALYEFRSNDEVFDRIKSGLDDRFQEIEVEGFINIWVHQFIDEARNEIDAYAFAKRTRKGALVLGISQTWRDNSDAEEFMQNIGMAEKTFAALLPGEMFSPVKVMKDDSVLKAIESKSALSENDTPLIGSPDKREDADEQKAEREEDPEEANETEPEDRTDDRETETVEEIDMEETDVDAFKDFDEENI